MKILVTGGAGFIGSHLVDALIAKKHNVVVVDDLSTGKKENVNKKAKFYQVDIRQAAELEKVFKKEKPELIFHLAAQMNVRRSIIDPPTDAAINILGGLNLLELAVKYKIKKFNFFSTGGAMFNDDVKFPTPCNTESKPISPYGIAKFTIENYLRFYTKQHKLKYAVIRPTNVYGPRQNHLGEAGVVSVFFHVIKNNLPFYLYGGSQTRDFIYVKDVVNICLKLLSPTKQGIYNASTQKETSIKELVEKLIKISQRKAKIIKKPYIKGEVHRSCLVNRETKSRLHWQPKYDLNKGLKETWEWFDK